MTDEPAVYCLLCGRVARYRGHSLDPTRPLVACRWTAPDGTIHGHGTLPGTYSQDEAQALVDMRLVRKRDQDHQDGRHDGKPNSQCPGCQVVLIHRRHVKLIAPAQDCPLCRADPILSKGLQEPV